MSRSEWFSPTWKWLRRFALLAIPGLIALIFATTRMDTTLGGIALFFAFATLAPLIFWLCFVPIMHWRERYKGNHLYVWGGFLVFETSGWTKILYWFMHVLPDSKGEGRYSDAP